MYLWLQVINIPRSHHLRYVSDTLRHTKGE